MGYTYRTIKQSLTPTPAQRATRKRKPALKVSSAPAGIVPDRDALRNAEIVIVGRGQLLRFRSSIDAADALVRLKKLYPAEDYFIVYLEG
jgi:hypothetical protein